MKSFQQSAEEDPDGDGDSEPKRQLRPRERSVFSRRGFLAGAGLVGATAVATASYAGHDAISGALTRVAGHPGGASSSGSTLSGAAAPASGKPPGPAAPPDRTFVSTQLTAAHVSSWATAATAAGLIFAGPQGHGSSGLIVDNHGEPVWMEPTGVGVTDLRVQTFEGKPVLTYWTGTGTGGHGMGSGSILDTGYQPVAQVNAGNGLKADLHEFTLTEAGTALLIAYPTVPYDLRPVGGPANGFIYDCHVQEVDVRSGAVLLDWSAVAHIDITETYVQPGDNNASADGTSEAKAFDPFHLNSVDESGDALLVSSRHMHALYLVDRTAGTLRWRLGGKRSDFKVADNAAFAWQHDARRRSATSLTVFDNHYSSGSTGISRGLLLNVDESARTVTLQQEFSHAGHRGNAEGNVQLLGNGHYLVGWGADPAVTEFTPDGTALYESIGLGNASYRTYRCAWTGRPATVPDIAVLPGNGSSMQVYASWNGATEVASWRFLTGETLQSLMPAGTVPRRGFETSTAVAAAAKVAVQALHSDGSVLATSKAVST
ncbi:arylsulfotransferase family protein [Arthrobacter sp. H14-L1]|uniref:arylsulfotransferase family protein n=1 Tax=Arthrobacter sp. H14-L1 TaxID=2996697 RepID=UPI00226FE4C8|nr:arylsulfotransferase family protein [Arthrobacter sp. H14-L1]MCY0904686.1 arylsulfotransferase family protein [Arthrobacter sp. H14-L1]